MTGKQLEKVCKKFKYINKSKNRNVKHIKYVLYINSILVAKTLIKKDKNSEFGNGLKKRILKKEIFLTEPEFKQAHKCTFSNDDYLKKLKKLKKIS